MPTKKPRCPNGSRRKPKKTGKCIKTKKKSSASGNSFLKGIRSKSSKTLTLPSSKSSSKSSKTKKKGNYRSFLKCEMKKLKKENPDMRQQNIMKMAAKNWNKGK
jgi:hypothetical protein|tara:strand:+ start:293 stop:604 length:312 start_codon:yes stop_codon:yes gene_type:complete